LDAQHGPVWLGRRDLEPIEGDLLTIMRSLMRIEATLERIEQLIGDEDGEEDGAEP
jgi:hypothetical protein